MLGQRKNYSSDLKARVAVEAIRGQKTANEIAAEYGVHPTQIAQWKKQEHVLWTHETCLKEKPAVGNAPEVSFF